MSALHRTGDRRGADPQPGPSPVAGWCVDGRIDPITGLVAFPDFDAEFPDILTLVAASGGTVGLAVGDVDNLKDHVETTNHTRPGSYGHLAGFAVMTRLGEVAREWFHDQQVVRGCVSTFGGDEVIVALLTVDAGTFHRQIGELQTRLNQALPRTVSFALGVIDSTPRADRSDWARDCYLRAVTMLDRQLFESKASRRRDNLSYSFVTVVDLAGATTPAPEATS